MENEKTLVITGVTGRKSGGYFARLIEDNYDLIKKKYPGGVRAIVRPTSNTKIIDNFISIEKKYVGELIDINFLTKAFCKADTVMHIAGIHNSRYIVDAAACCKIRRLILVHTTGIYSKYKAAGEEYRKIDEYVYKVCKQNDILLTILRPTMIYGNVYDENIVTFIKMVDKLPVIPIVNGGIYELQPVHYKDLANAYFSVILNEDNTVNKDFNLSGGAPIMLKDMLEEIGKNLNKKVKFINCPFVIAYIGAWMIYLCSFSKIDYREKVQRLCEPRVFSYSAASKAFDYSPRTFQEGIVQEVKQYLKVLGN